MIATCCRRVSDSGPVNPSTSPTCPPVASSVSATAAMSSWWIGAIWASGLASSTVDPRRMVSAHHSKALVAKAPGRSTVTGSPEASSLSSTALCRRAIELVAASGWSTADEDTCTMCLTPPAASRNASMPSGCV